MKFEEALSAMRENDKLAMVLASTPVEWWSCAGAWNHKGVVNIYKQTGTYGQWQLMDICEYLTAKDIIDGDFRLVWLYDDGRWSW